MHRAHSAQSRGREPVSFGSGVLLGIAGERFLLTAAHVLDDAKESPLYVPGGHTLVMLPTQSTVTKALSDDRDLDHLDVGFIHLPPQLAKSRLDRQALVGSAKA
jgi:hypothetical protein